MAHFEIVSKYKNDNVNLPKRKTKESAGYDFEVLQDTLVPSYYQLMQELENLEPCVEPKTLEEVESVTKTLKIRPTLVPTGIKAKLDAGTYLELSVRSSLPLKHWLIMGNSVGVIDADYYNNQDNEGHIYFQLINLSPYPIILRKGQAIGQGIIKPYIKADGDSAEAIRTGGFGSTTLSK